MIPPKAHSATKKKAADRADKDFLVGLQDARDPIECTQQRVADPGPIHEAPGHQDQHRQCDQLLEVHA
jgi:hypothetical protein